VQFSGTHAAQGDDPPAGAVFMSVHLYITLPLEVSWDLRIAFIYYATYYCIVPEICYE
jgi:hypothetical protein